MEDEPRIRRVVRMALLSQGFEVTEARSGEEGLEEFREHLPDPVLLDLRMSGIGGLVTCRRLRSGSEAPIIGLTVRSKEEEKVEALEEDAGRAVHILTEPSSVLERL